MKRRYDIKNILGGIIAAALLAAVIIALIPIVSRAEESKNQLIVDETYSRLADEYKADLREYLEDAGYENAGITLTYVSLKDGARTYTALIHHRRLSGLEKAQADILSAELEETGRCVMGCDVTIAFDNE